MRANPSFSGKLEFLNTFVHAGTDRYRSAPWLRSSFEANQWLCVFSESLKFEISFNIHLYNKESLTDAKHSELLFLIKAWICVQTHPDACDEFINAANAKQRVLKTLHVIDYFLLNGKNYNLAKYGLLALTKNDFILFFFKLSISKSIYKNIYEWPERLSDFLRKKIKTLSVKVFNNLVLEFKFLSDPIPDHIKRALSLTDQEVFMSRAWLWDKGYYQSTSGKEGYRYGIAISKVVGEIYGNTLNGLSKKPAIEELLLCPYEICCREFNSVDVRTGNEDKFSASQLNTYTSIVKNLGLLAEHGYPTPIALSEICWDGISKHLDLKPPGRFLTIPTEIIYFSLRNAIEFSLEFGDDIVKSYLAILCRSRSNGTTCWNYSNQHPIENIITPRIRKLGVRYWSISRPNGSDHGNINRKADYFRALRMSSGLWELVKVLYGCVAICVGILMARRVSELQDLIAGSCLDVTGKFLIFHNRKSGPMGLRKKIMRPIPPIAVKMIRQLERIQKELVKIGEIPHLTNLFSCPPQRSNGRLSSMHFETINGSIDFFCDYFETPITHEGERYYIRTHQLRRAFAMIFFWSGASGKMDTLRWFLGHTDMEHLYNYITESTDGVVLRSIKAEYCSQIVVAGASDLHALSDLIESKFGTRVFSILDQGELCEYMDYLLEVGNVEAEPVFFETPSGQSFRIAIKVISG